MSVRNRIIEIRKMKASELAKNPLNYRKHPPTQKEALQAGLQEIGQAGVFMAYTNSAGQITLLDGHLRQEVDPEMEWDVAITDFTEEEANKFLLTYDTISSMATHDKEILEKLLEQTTTEDKKLAQMFDTMAKEAGVDLTGGMLVDTLMEADAFGKLPDSDRAPFQQMTFTVHDMQAESIREAIKISKSMGEFTDTENENSNGNALARICEMFITDYGNS